jgi:hypothetical protein
MNRLSSVVVGGGDDCHGDCPHQKLARRQAVVGKELRTRIEVVCPMMSHPTQTTERMG